MNVVARYFAENFKRWVRPAMPAGHMDDIKSASTP